jgi:hypothetical protein
MSRRVRPRPFLIEFEFLRISHLLTRKHDIGGHEFSLSSIVTPAVRGHAVSDNVREVPRPALSEASSRKLRQGHGPITTAILAIRLRSNAPFQRDV